jgi:large subunit ribosomal protein L10
VERQKKEAMVGLLRDEFTRAKAVFVTDFKFLPVSAMVSLRGKVRQSGGQYRVVKNTLVKLASKDQSAEKLSDLLVGNNGLGITNGDPVLMAKVLQDFVKEQNKFVIKGALLGEQVLDPVRVKALAALPSREALLSTLLGTMLSVPGSFVRVLAAVPQKLLYALSALRDLKAGSETPA